MIRKTISVGKPHIRPFIFTKICSSVRTKINGNLSQQQGSTTLSSAGQEEDISLENKILADSPALGKSTASTFFLGAKGGGAEIPASTLPTPTK